MKKMIVLLLSSYFLIAGTQLNITFKPANVYAGGIIALTMIGDEVVDKMDGIILYHGYVLEPRMTTVITSYNSLKASGKVTSDASKNGTMERFDGFILSRLKDSISAIFDTVNVLKEKILFGKKKQGLVLKRDSPLLLEHLDSFIFYKDTLINTIPFKLYICDFRNNPGSKGMQKIVLYSDMTLKGFPFHPLSQTLDEKFGGVIMKAHFITDDRSSLKVDIKYRSGLDKESQKRVVGLMRAANWEE